MHSLFLTTLVLLGRGPTIAKSPGNVYFMSLVDHYGIDYINAPKLEKVTIARRMVAKVRRKGGRFLHYDAKHGKWSKFSLKAEEFYQVLIAIVGNRLSHDNCVMINILRLGIQSPRFRSQGTAKSHAFTVEK